LKDVINQTIGEREIKNIRIWQNLDDADDYLCVDFERDGYAVFYKESMEMLEYSPTQNLPNYEGKVYYCGPKNVFAKTTSYSSYSSIPNETGENVTRNLNLSRQGVSMFTFAPPVTGTYTFTTNGTSDNVIYLIDPLNATSEAIFGDDNAGNMQGTVTGNSLYPSIKYLIIVSFYSLYSTGNTTIASVNITKVS